MRPDMNLLTDPERVLQTLTDEIVFLFPPVYGILTFSYQSYSFIGTGFSSFGNSVSFINIVLDVAVGLESYCGIE